MSYSIWLCSKRIIFFSTSQILHFWNKVPMWKKGKNVFFCLTVYYHPLSVLQVRKNPEKTSTRKPVPTGDRTRPAAWQASMLPPGPQRWTRSLKFLRIMYELKNLWLCYDKNICSWLNKFKNVMHSCYRNIIIVFMFTKLRLSL